MFFLYNLLLAAVSLVLVPVYFIRGKYRGTLRQRLGLLPPQIQQTGGRCIWLHAVSVGEVLSCQELLARLRARLPAVRIVVSTTTSTGQRMAREKLGSLADGIFYAPLDYAFAVRRTLAAVRPYLVIITETEIWPNLFRETKRFGATLLMVNARISDRSAPRYRRCRFFFRSVLRLPDSILAQTELDRQRLVEAGAPAEIVEVGGNLKFDVRTAEGRAPAEIVSLLNRLKPRAVILAGSTRESEEVQALAAFREVSQRFERLLLILAPRNPDRFDQVAKILSEGGWSFVRRSRWEPGASLSFPGVLLLDTLGELASLYALADVVFVGGSLVNWGGHNVLEPAMAGRPIVVGPHMQNFRAVADSLLGAGGLVQVGGAQELGPVWARLLENPAEAATLGSNARRVAELHRGATDRAVDRAERLYHLAVPDPLPRYTLLLWTPARLWEIAVRSRDCALRRKLDAFTISVGNLTAGGTGKTPVVLWLLEQLQARGVECALLTRGYRRSSPEKTTILEPGAEAPLDRTGDEVQIYLRRFAIPVGIAADRYAAGREIERRFHSDVFVLDDGFQHCQLERDLDIVLVDVTRPFGGGEFLPLGRLREPPAALGRADAIVLTRTQPGERWDGLTKELRRHNSRAPIFFSRVEPVALVEANTGEERPLSSLQERRVLAFCGVGNPDAFWETLERGGIAPTERLCYRDHHRYSASDMRRWIADALVTTEKDWINLGGQAPPHLYWLKTRLIVDRGEELLDLVRISHEAAGSRYKLGR